MLFVFQLTLNDYVIFCGSKYPFSQVPLLARKAGPKEQAAFGSNASQKHPRRFQCGQDSQQIVVDISLEFLLEKKLWTLLSGCPVFYLACTLFFGDSKAARRA